MKECQQNMVIGRSEMGYSDVTKWKTQCETGCTQIGKLQPAGHSGLLPIVTNKVLLEHTQVYLFTYGLSPFLCYNSKAE